MLHELGSNAENGKEVVLLEKDLQDLAKAEFEQAAASSNYVIRSFSDSKVQNWSTRKRRNIEFVKATVPQGSTEAAAAGSSRTRIGKKDDISIRDVKDQVMASFRCVKELMAAGIRIKGSSTRCLRDISFTSNGITACLRLPPITIDKFTKAIFLYSIAYQMSYDLRHDFISYLGFLDSLNGHADDVKEMQYAGVLQNNLGTHEQAADFFNTLSANLESNFHSYKDVRVKIRNHLKSHYNRRLKMC